MKRLIVLLMFALGSFNALSQEICNNGRDDDGDGFIDCYDNSCSASTFCKDFFLGEEAECEVTPPAFPQFTMALDFSSPNETTNHLARMAIGDLDRDGTPEIVTMNRYTKRLFILSGKDGSIKEQKTVDFTPNWEIAIANVDDDDCGEIYFLGTDRRIYAYDCELNYLWRTVQMPGDPINYGIADFDGDGKAELYAKDMIFDAHTGTRIVETTASEWDEINGGPVAVDMEGDSNLELVIGCSIYSVDLGDRSDNSGSLTLLKSRSEYYIRNEYNATSVADYNQDGFLDVLASGSTEDHGENTTVFFWDVKNNTLKTYSDPIPGDFTIYACPTQTGPYYEKGWKNGTGRLNIADLDGDGNLNVSYVSGKFLYALDHNMTPMPWSPKVVNEETSGHTGCTLFDFNGDGKSEIVYRDEKFLYIINGTDGTIFNQQTCISRTNREYPIVADVDADGSTEMCVTCGFDDEDAVDEFCDLNYSRYSHVRVFKSGGDPWVPARRVWNQHGYFNVNVNDDLTIPIQQQKHHLVFSTGSCTTGPNRPLNGFLNQSPFLNIDGCPTYKSPDLAFVDNSLAVTPPTCPNTTFSVSFVVQNIGDIGLSGAVPISFYNGNPMQAGAIKLKTLSEPMTLSVDGTQSVSTTVAGPGGPFTLYIVLNDNGTKIPTPITLPNTNFLECDYNNNVISSPVVSIPVAITALKVKDNLKCVGSSSPDNGAVRAFIPTGSGGESTAEYRFYWSAGTAAKPIPADYEGSAINALPEGTYTVYAIHKTANCSSDTASVTIDRTGDNIAVTVDVVDPYTNCKNPNGKLRAIVNGGQDEDDFDFVWYEGNDIFTDPQVSIEADPENLKPLTYTVVVTEKATGCQSIASQTVPDNSVQPVVTATAVGITCAAGNIGSVSATIGGSTAGYTFRWYNGNSVKPSADFTGADYSNLGGGNYTVVVTRNSTKCESAPVTVTVTQTAPVTISVTGISHQTSCDASLPNGTASANVGGTTAGFDFEWFRGANTMASNRFATTASVGDLKAGVYTVKATQTSSGCFDTEQITINSAVVNPSLILAAVGDLTNCTTPDGSVTVNVSLNSPSDYTFSWYIGPDVKTTPDFTDTDNVLQNLEVGTYTVRAVHNTKHCTTGPITATVDDNTPTIQIVQDPSVKKLPTDCKSNDGLLEISVSATGNTLGFRIEWFKNHSTIPFAAVDGVTVSRQDTLSSAVYTIMATNLNNGCSVSESFDLPFATAQSLDLVSKADATTCSPENEGNIVVMLTPTPATIPGPPPVSFTVDDYVINFYAGQGTSGTLLQSVPGSSGISNGDQTANYTFATLTPGFYTIVAVEDDPLLGGCASLPLVVEIKRDVIFPGIALTQVDANSNCSGSTANGLIELNIDGPAPEPNYSYAWFEGTNTSAPALGTNTSGSTSGSGQIAQNLPAGIYAVAVTNNATLCVSETVVQIMETPPVISIPATDATVTHVTMCSDLDGGAIAVSNIREDGAIANMADYTFEWFDANMNILPNAGAPNNTNTINNLIAGTYFVQVTKISGSTGLSCASDLTAFEIEDQTIGTVNVSLADFTQPTRCLQPANITGELVANASGTSTTGYDYEWYAGSTATGAIVSTNGTMSGITIPLGQTDITFTIRAINNSNDCSVDETFVLPLNVVPVIITSSASPVTSCLQDDGSIFATVTSGNSNAYTYNWSIGIGVKPVADLTGKQHNNLGIGNYTVFAVDNNDSFCQSEADTVNVADAKVFPIVTALEVAPLTICDPARPDGVASASVDGDVVNYHFSWYNGAPPTGAPVYTGSQFGNLPASTFSVVAAHLVSGCADTTQITINENIIAIPVPQVEVMSHKTSCETNNGALAASVNGNTSDFIFHWYNDNPGQPVDTASSVLIAEIYNDLNVGDYYVSATSRITGCISPAAVGDILDAPVLPAFEFVVSSPTCSVFGMNEAGGFDSNGEPNGSLVLNLLNSIEIRSITWYAQGNNTAIGTGPILSNIEAGFYEAEVVSTVGCRHTEQVEVKPEINPFNGISRNGDDLNPIFHINCIENFPENHVKIYNRAGTLVYEAIGYNNVDTYFDGKSNKGINLMGTNLPDGTYFYIIDKRDGSKQIAGYVEVVN